MLYPAIFLDRDGVINKLLFNGDPTDPANFVNSWSQFEFLPGVIETLHDFIISGFHLVIASNQGGIGYGNVPIVNISFIFNRMKATFMEAGIPINYIFCPHHPDDKCACRKPMPGMIFKAAVDLNIRLSDSWMIGDSCTDIVAARNAGIENRIRIGNAECDITSFIAADLPSAAKIILG